jgi:hypothetical protein
MVSIPRRAFVASLAAAAVLRPGGAWPGPARILADPAEPLERAWMAQSFAGVTDYAQVSIDGRAAIRAIGRNSASGLYRRVSLDLAVHPILRWEWRVDRLQPSADLAIGEREDFAAALFLLSGDSADLMAPERVLVYAWTTARHDAESVVPSPHYPDRVRTIVVESGTQRLGRWTEPRRVIADDFARAFGRPAPTQVGAIALFTDNDQTLEPVRAYYGPIEALMRTA